MMGILCMNEKDYNKIVLTPGTGDNNSIKLYG